MRRFIISGLEWESYDDLEGGWHDHDECMAERATTEARVRREVWERVLWRLRSERRMISMDSPVRAMLDLLEKHYLHDQDARDADPAPARTPSPSAETQALRVALEACERVLKECVAEPVAMECVGDWTLVDARAALAMAQKALGTDDTTPQALVYGCGDCAHYPGLEHRWKDSSFVPEAHAPQTPGGEEISAGEADAEAWCETAPKVPASRLFHLDRAEDEGGVSGTGRVAEGVAFSDGTCALRWLTKTQSSAIYDSIKDVETIHGHNGKTRVVWETPPAPDPVKPSGSPLIEEARALLSDKERYIGYDAQVIIGRLMVAYEEERAQRREDPVKEALATAAKAVIDNAPYDFLRCTSGGDGKPCKRCVAMRTLRAALARYEAEGRTT